MIRIQKEIGFFFMLAALTIIKWIAIDRTELYAIKLEILFHECEGVKL